MPNLLIAERELPAEIMEQDEAVPEKQANVDEVEMVETEPTAQAAAAAVPAAGAAAAPAASYWPGRMPKLQSKWK